MSQTLLQTFADGPLKAVHHPKLVHLRKNVVLAQQETFLSASPQYLTPLIYTRNYSHADRGLNLHPTTLDAVWPHHEPISIPERSRLRIRDIPYIPPTMNEGDISELQRISESIDNCGTDIQGFISCGCSSIPVYNQCGQYACPGCWIRRSKAKRKQWLMRMRHDRGRSYRFLTLTEPRRYFDHEVGDAVDRLHTRLRTMSKLKWWRKHFRLWFGTIEIEPVWELFTNGYAVTFNVHLHMVTSGRMPDVDALRSRWVKYGGGHRVNIVLIASQMRKRHARADSVVRYITKYFTSAKQEKCKIGKDVVRKVGLSDLPQITRAILSRDLKGRHLFISGGDMRGKLTKRMRQSPEQECRCSICNNRVSYRQYESVSDEAQNRMPTDEQWVWVDFPT